MRHLWYFAGYALLNDFLEKQVLELNQGIVKALIWLPTFFKMSSFLLRTKKNKNRLRAFSKSVKRSSSKSNKYENCFYTVASPPVCPYTSLYIKTTASLDRAQTKANEAQTDPTVSLKYFWGDKKQT